MHPTTKALSLLAHPLTCTGINAAYLLALAAAHGCTDVASLLLHPPAWMRAILAGPVSQGVRGVHWQEAEHPA